MPTIGIGAHDKLGSTSDSWAIGSVSEKVPLSVMANLLVDYLPCGFGVLTRGDTLVR